MHVKQLIFLDPSLLAAVKLYMKCSLSICKRILKHFYDFSNRFLPLVHAILFLKARF